MGGAVTKGGRTPLLKGPSTGCKSWTKCGLYQDICKVVKGSALRDCPDLMKGRGASHKKEGWGGRERGAATRPVNPRLEEFAVCMCQFCAVS